MAKIYKTEAEIQAAIDARDLRLFREMVKGSTGSYGKRFESEQRLSYKMTTGQNIYRDDFKAKDPNKVDMFVRVNGHKRRVELKTGRGAVVYCDDEQQAWEQLEKLTRSTCLFVWDAFKDGNPMCFIMSDMLKCMASYKGKGLKGWFEYIQPTDYRSGQIQFRPFATSKVKCAFLAELDATIGMDWETIKEDGEI